MKKHDDQKQTVEEIQTQQENLQETVSDGNNSEEQSKTAELLQEIDVWKVKYSRALADYQNLERRTREEKEQIRKFSAEMTIKQLLPAIDGLEVAASHIQNDGLNLSMKQFYTVLESLGVKKIHTKGVQFDPHHMECIDVAEGEEGIVIEELSPGYTLYDKIIRVAKVKVGKNKQ